MIIVAVTDIHGSVSALDALGPAMAAADLVLLTGDLTSFGRAAEAAQVIDAARAHNPNVLAVPGNCDHPEVADYLMGEDINLDGEHRVIDGLAIAGLGGSLPCPGHTPGEFTEGELKRKLAAAVDGLDPALPLVLVSHQPPIDTDLDLAQGTLHVGSRSVRDFIEQRTPLVCLSGHIHEATGIDAIGPTRLANPGPARAGHYTYAEIGEALDVLEIR